ncbi:Nance-Horan syndrome protein-like, partial [Plectropomus leopardus]|uniref:Nance-Horan syndrome protein-like n=1 Tax=Plectropomus leopardus TaxID=160734 RepID=UPI001C4BD359
PDSPAGLLSDLLRLSLTAVSNLDVESKLTAHYQAPWHQQRNVFHPSTRPACVVDLHRQANLSLWALHRDHLRRRSGSRERRVTISISAVPPMPMYPSPNIAQRKETRSSNLTTFESTRSSSPTECCRFSPWSRKVVVPPSLPPSRLLRAPSKTLFHNFLPVRVCFTLN